MGLKVYIERDTREPDVTGALDDAFRDVAREQLVPRIVERHRAAVNQDRRECYFYARRLQGRQCSCFDLESSPDDLCSVCFGTRIVGAFDRYGSATEWVDVTYPGITMVNVRPAYELQTRPTLFTLDSGALVGALEARIPIRPNRRRAGAVRSLARTPPHTSVTMRIRSPNEAAWSALTERALEERLAESEVLLRVELRRAALTVPSPLFGHVMLRYNLLDDSDLLIPLDMARDERSVILQDVGIADDYQTIQANAANHLKRITTDDFFRRIEDDTNWKVRNVVQHKSMGIVTGYELSLRLAIHVESYVRVP